jgi:ribonuclease P protein component
MVVVRSLPYGALSSAGNDEPRAGVAPSSPNGCRPDQRLGRNRRLTRSAEFREAYAQNRCFVGRFMVMWLRSGKNASLRLGVVSGRSVGGAVDRNRARRRLREVFRTNRYRLSGEVDVVLVARRPLLQAKWEEITGEFEELAARAGLLRGRMS